MNRQITKIARAATRYSCGSMGENSISETEYECLHLIRKNDGVNQMFLSKRLHVDKAMITRIVANLENKGFIVRIRSDGDRRSFELHATEKAWKMRDNVRCAETDFYNWLVEDIPPKELEPFLVTLQKLYDKSKNERGCNYANFLAWLNNNKIS
ncbi:MAG: MarR family winged helix-turn-helix transcriptional regulator [Clostridia bacterium]